MDSMEIATPKPKEELAGSGRGSPPEPGMKWKFDKRSAKGGYWYKPGVKRKGGTPGATDRVSKLARPRTGRAGSPARGADGISSDVAHAAGELLVVRSDTEDKLWLCEVTEDAATGQEHVKVHWLNEVHAGVFEVGTPDEIDSNRLLGAADLVELEHGKFYFTATARTKAEQLLHPDAHIAEDSEMLDEDEDGSTPAKKRRAASPKRGKETPPKPVVVALEADPFWDSSPGGGLPSAGVVDNIQVLHDKLAIRAVLQADAVELKRLAMDLSGTCSLHRPLNAFKAVTALQFALIDHKPELVEIFVEEQGIVAAAVKETPPRSRAKYPPMSLQSMDSGSVGFNAYRAHVRSVKLSRGGKEGNQAFVKDNGVAHCNPENPFSFQPSMQDLLKSMLRHGAKLPAFQQVYSISLKADAHSGCFHLLFGEACRSGMVDVALWFGDMALKNEGWGLNGLHTAVLQPVEGSTENNFFPTFKAISFTKKAVGNFRIMPILVAAINPDPRVLKDAIRMLGGGVNDTHEDEEGRSVLHYAAACTSADNLKFLIEDLGLQRDAKSMYNTTPLMVSCMLGRVDCVTFLLEKAADPTLSESSTLPMAQRRRRGMRAPTTTPDGLNAAHLCVEYEQKECLKVLLSKGVSVDTVDNIERRTLLHRACARNSVSIALELLAAKASVVKRDKLKRTPLILAAAGGSARLCSHLLVEKAGIDDVDSSGNTALHYAAGYGWLHTVQLLCKAGAKLTLNSWKTSPVMVALMKSHFGLVQWFTENATDLDLEQTNNDGHTLLALACKSADRRWVAVFQKLLERGADVKARDTKGLTPLHHLAQAGLDESDSAEGRTESMSTKNALIEMLVKQKADLNATNDAGQTPLLVALEKRKTSVIKTLLALGADPTVRTKDGRNILHLIASLPLERTGYSSFRGARTLDGVMKVKDDRPDVLKVLTQNCPPDHLHRMAETRDCTGSMPLHLIAASFVEDFQDVRKYNGDTSAEKAARRKLFFDLLVLYLSSTKASLLTTKGAPHSSKEASLGGSPPCVSETSPVVPLGSSGEPMIWRSHKSSKPVKCLATGDAIASSASCWCGQNPEEVLSGRALGDAGSTIVHILAGLDDPESMRFLLDRIGGPPDKRASQINVLGMSALSTAMSAPNRNSFDSFGQLITALVTGSDTCALEAKSLATGLAPLHAAVRLAKDLAATPSRQSFFGWPPPQQQPPKSLTPVALLVVQQILAAKADPASPDSLGRTALHHACTSRAQDLVEALLAASADPAACDRNGRTALHYLVNSSKGEESFELEQKVLSAAGEGRTKLVNAQDSQGRAALHYAFVKFSDDNVAPVQGENLGKSIVWQWRGHRCLVSSLKDDGLSKVGVSVGMQLSRVADESVEVKSEHPVKELYKAKHGASCMLTLRQQIKDSPAAVLFCATESLDPVEAVTSFCVEDLNVNIQDRFGMTPLHYAASRGATISTLTLIRRSADLQAVDGCGHNVLGRALLADHRDYAIMLIQKGLPAHGSVTVAVDDDDAKKSYFWQAMNKGRYGVSYLLLDEGYPLFEAIQDALDLSKADMARTLLGKVREDSVVQKTVPETGDSLLHVLARCNVGKLGSDGGVKVAEALKKRGLVPSAINREKETPLHLAAYQQNGFLVKWLMGCEGVSLAATDSAGRSALHRALLTTKSEAKALEMLSDLGPGTGVQLISACVADAEHAEKITILINGIRKLFFNLVTVLVEKHGVNVNICDSSDITPLMWSVKVNSIETAQKLLAAKADINAVDADGCSALHCCVQPIAFGSYENVDLLALLCKSGATVDLCNKAGKTPLALAYGQDSGRMSRMLKGAGATAPGDPDKFRRLKSGILTWQKNDVDFEAEAALAVAEASAAMEEKREPRAVHQSYGMSGQNEVAVLDGTVYDAMMVKVDVKKGEYGENNFYHMQLIYEKLQDLYVLFTRWGRIGETGMYQRTPCDGREDALKEWGKIFKSKSGNEWAKRDEFEKKPNRYSLLSLENAGVKRASLLKPFAEKPPVASKLSPSLQRTLKTITSLTLMNRTLQKHSINMDAMPFTRLSRSQLQAGLATLKAVGDQVATVLELKKTPGVGGSELQAAKERLLELSSEYYTLIPKAQNVNEPMQPIKTDKQLSEEWKMLQDLLEMEIAAKVLLAAKHVEKDIHPLDYVYNALDAEIEPLSPSSDEFHLLRQYLLNTTEGKRPRISTIYRVQRRGEAARMEAWAGLERHRLLWHGTGTSNLVGILAQGLRIAPPEAPMSGYAFGKGLYFADMFTKSEGYCSSGGDDAKYLLLAEVALGEMMETKQARYMEAAAPGTQSTRAVGKRGPDWSRQSVYLPNGVQIPIGKPMNLEKEKAADESGAKQQPATLSFNEFVVYDASQVRIRYLIEVNNGPSLVEEPCKAVPASDGEGEDEEHGEEEDAEDDGEDDEMSD